MSMRLLIVLLLLACAPKQAHVVLFVPGMQKDGTPVDQEKWTAESLAFFGSTFGGATALPKGKGVWRDDTGALHYEDTVMIQAWMPRATLEEKRAALEAYCRKMATEAKQNEVGVVINGEYVGFPGD